MDPLIKICIMAAIWGVIIFNLYILFNSRKMFKNLKKLELACLEKRRDFIHNYVPVMHAITQHSSNLNLALKKSSLQAFLYAVPELVQSINACQNLSFKASINFLQWLLK